MMMDRSLRTLTGEATRIFANAKGSTPEAVPELQK
jgi:hypothetical protein